MTQILVPWCEPDRCPATICGGPHVAIETDLGTELIPVGSKPVGTPLVAS